MQVIYELVYEGPISALLSDNCESLCDPATRSAAGSQEAVLEEQA